MTNKIKCAEEVDKDMLEDDNLVKHINNSVVRVLEYYIPEKETYEENIQKGIDMFFCYFFHVFEEELSPLLKYKNRKPELALMFRTEFDKQYPAAIDSKRIQREACEEKAKIGADKLFAFVNPLLEAGIKREDAFIAYYKSVSTNIMKVVNEEGYNMIFYAYDWKRDGVPDTRLLIATKLQYRLGHKHPTAMVFADIKYNSLLETVGLIPAWGYYGTVQTYNFTVTLPTDNQTTEEFREVFLETIKTFYQLDKSREEYPKEYYEKGLLNDPYPVQIVNDHGPNGTPMICETFKKANEFDAGQTREFHEYMKNLMRENN